MAGGLTGAAVCQRRIVVPVEEAEVPVGPVPRAARQRIEVESAGPVGLSVVQTFTTGPLLRACLIVS
jgi:hypothetical protein